MAKQTINLGTAPTGVGGDTPRSAFTKTQANFDELYTALGGNTLPVLPVARGGTGASTGTDALANLGGLQKSITNQNMQGTAFSSTLMPAIASINGSSNDRNGSLQISNGANTFASAILSFIREGSYGIHLGLDTDNKMKIGGWSMGGVARTLYHEGNVLGTVSQSSTLPTGALIERGSNSNGSYVKFADGTMICWYYSGVSYTLSQQYAAVYLSPSLSYTFPVAFAGTPMVVPSAITTPAVVWAAIEGSASSAAMTMRLVGIVNGTTSYAGYIATGRWW